MLLLELRKAEAGPLPEKDGTVSCGIPRSVKKDEARSRRLLWQFACVLIGLGFAFTSFFVLLQRKELSDVRQAPEAGIITLSPAIDQALSGPVVFRWRGDARAEHYVLELFDEALLPVWASGKVVDTHVSLPPDVGSMLQPGRRYYWMITAYAQEAVIEESRLVRFVISLRRNPVP